MNWLQDIEQIEQREDGTFVVQATIDGVQMPYHITPGYSPELYASVCAFLGIEIPEPATPEII